MRQKLLLLTAVLFGVLAFFLTYRQLKQERLKLKSITRQVVLVRLKNTKIEGDSIDAGDIEPVKVERLRSNITDEIPYSKRITDVIKHKVSQMLEKGTILRYSDLKPERIRSKDGLAGFINLGQRAISIPVDTVSSVTNLVKPGDRVDLIASFRFPELKGDKTMDMVTLTLLQNVYILAVGKDLPVQSKNRRKNKGYSTVTIAVTPKEAEMIIFALQKGRIALSLRSYQETGYEKNLQSVNFKYLEEKIPEYNKAREKRERSIRY